VSGAVALDAWFEPRDGDQVVVGVVVAVPPERLAELRELYELLDPAFQRLELEEVERALRAPGVTVFGAVDRATERLIGVATLITAPTFPRMRAWAEDLVVHPDFRGRRVGAALMDACADVAAAAGARTMEGTVHPTRTSALTLHRRAGWEFGSSVVVRRHL
jgi:GNAT superfamily N-acetyltransferase